MAILLTILGIWAVTAVIFYILVRVEGNKHNAQPNALQVVVSALWFFWLGWFIIETVREKYRGQ